MKSQAVILAMVMGGTCLGQGLLTKAQRGVLEEPGTKAPGAAFSFDAPQGPTFAEEQRKAQVEAGKGVVAMVRKAFDSGAASVRIPPGDYRFGQETWGPVGPIYPLEFAGLKRDADHTFTIDARGVTFWFDLTDDEAATAHFCLGFRDCANIILRGATIDRGTRGNVEGKIVQIDAPGNRFEIKLTKGCVVPTKFNGDMNQRVVPFKADGTFPAPLYALQPGGVHLMYKGIVPGEAEGLYWVTMNDSALMDTLRDPNWAKAYGEQGMLRVGDGISCVYTVAEAIGVVGCRNMTMEGVSIYAAKANPSETGGYGAHLWKNCYIGPRPGTNQWQGGEGFMFNGTGHGTTLDGVTIRHTADDCCNVHGYWGHVKSVAGERMTFEVNWATGHALAYDAAVGDKILFWDKESGSLVGEAKVVAIDGDSVVLDKEAGQFANAVAEWVDHECAGWLIQNCDWSDDYQRVLFQSGPGAVRNCKFTRLGSSLELNSDFPYVEGGIATDIRVTGNTFTDVNPMPGGAAISVHFHTYGAGQGWPMSGIEIVGNTFVRPGGPAIELSNVSASNIEGNRFERVVEQTAIARGGEAGVRQAVWLVRCAGMRVGRTVLIDPGKWTRADGMTGSKVIGMGEGCEGVVVDGKAVGGG